MAQCYSEIQRNRAQASADEQLTIFQTTLRRISNSTYDANLSSKNSSQTLLKNFDQKTSNISARNIVLAVRNTLKARLDDAWNPVWERNQRLYANSIISETNETKDIEYNRTS